MVEYLAKEKAWDCVNTPNLDKRNYKQKAAAKVPKLPNDFNRELLPDPLSYYEAHGLTLKGPRNASWKTTECHFHGGSDSLRIKMTSGAFVCMACGARGGDVLAYEMAVNGVGFVQAAKQLGAWTAGKIPLQHMRPTALTARDALSVLADEVTLIALEGTRIARGVVPTANDLERIQRAAGRVNHLRGMFA